MGDKTKGWMQKYIVERTDRTDAPGGKHEDCDLFVLDFQHDPIAIRAGLEYATLAFNYGYHALARDMVRRIQASPNFHAEYISKRHEWVVERADMFDTEHGK